MTLMSQFGLPRFEHLPTLVTGSLPYSFRNFLWPLPARFNVPSVAAFVSGDTLTVLTL